MTQKKTYPIPALAQQIEFEWAEELAAYYGRAFRDVAEKVRPWFSFPTGTLRIELMDRSSVEFHYAIFIVSEPKRAVTVFTEHCGHHLFPYHEARIYRNRELVYEQVSAQVLEVPANRHGSNVRNGSTAAVQ